MKRLTPYLRYCSVPGFSTLAVPVTFQLDLQSRIDNAEFVPGTNRIVVRGNFNGWAGNSVVLAPTQAGPTLYTATTDVTNQPGSTVEFKFVQVRDGSADIWENDPNRAFVLLRPRPNSQSPISTTSGKAKPFQ